MVLIEDDRRVDGALEHALEIGERVGCGVAGMPPRGPARLSLRNDR